jgi:hypothetical protein
MIQVNLPNTYIHGGKPPINFTATLELTLNNNTTNVATIPAFGTNSLFQDRYPLTAEIATAEVIRGGVGYDIKTSSASTASFTVAVGETCIFRVRSLGLFSFGTITNNGAPFSSFRPLMTRMKFTTHDDIEVIPNGFLGNLCSQCARLTDLQFDTLGFGGVKIIGNSFLYGAWGGCTNLLIVPIFDTTDWEVTSIGTNFLHSTWGALNSSNLPIVNTTKWRITTIPDGFMTNTYSFSYSQPTALIVDTSNWLVTSIGDNFLYSTWSQCGFTTAAVPDTSKWVITSIGNYFMNMTWRNHGFLTTPKIIDTSKWPVTSIGNYFMNYTWHNCSGLTGGAIWPDTSNWTVNTIGSYFLAITYADCTYLTSGSLPDARKWNVTSRGNYFIGSTFDDSMRQPGPPSLKVVTIYDSLSNPVYGSQNSPAGLSNNSVVINLQIRVSNALIGLFRTNWSTIDSNKFVGF